MRVDKFCTAAVILTAVPQCRSNQTILRFFDGESEARHQLERAIRRGRGLSSPRSCAHFAQTLADATRSNPQPHIEGLAEMLCVLCCCAVPDPVWYAEGHPVYAACAAQLSFSVQLAHTLRAAASMHI